MNKLLTTLTLSIISLTSCTKDTPFFPDLNQTPVRGNFKTIENDKEPNVTSFLSKGDSTTRGGWLFEYSHLQDTAANSTMFRFYVTTPFNNNDNVTGTIDFTTNLSGSHLADSVMSHDIVYYYVYKGTGTWRLQSQTGDLQNYFKNSASGTLTYEYIKYTKDGDGIPWDNTEYHATLDGTEQ